jgi:manganese-dependent inorganic pyrophosphatase
MEKANNPLRVIGHKNPDTDSICSAIAYARLKDAFLGEPAIAYRAGNTNAQTEFVLSHFGVESPDFLADVYPRLSDIMVGEDQLITLKETDSLGKAQDILIDHRFSFLPVVDAAGKYCGQVNTLRIVALFRELAIPGGRSTVCINLRDFIDAVRGSILPSESVPEQHKARIIIHGVAGAAEPPPPSADTPGLSIAPFAPDAVSEALERNIGYVFLCGGREEDLTEKRGFDRALINRAAEKGIRIIATPFGLLQTAVQAYRAMPLADFVEREHITFLPDDLVRRVQRQIGRYNEGGFTVVDENGYARGVITRINFLDHNRFRVVMVDHNEFAQAVNGIEEAEVVEIIDHHRLGATRSDAPITFINKVVGSTSTIISELYKTRGFKPDTSLCGIMLASILSDTVILKSPTTTDLDREMAQWLASETGIDLEAFGEKMFMEGSSLKGRSAHEMILQDRKTYAEEDWKFSISQIEVIGFKRFFDRRGEFQKALQEITEREQNAFSGLIVTDITEQTSVLLIQGSKLVADSISYPEIMHDFFEMRGVISRKKQVIPYLLDILRNL